MPTDRSHRGSNGTTWRNDEERFLSKVEKQLLLQNLGECWIWMHSRYEKGYGKFKFKNRMLKAHRWAYEYWIEKIPENLQIDHLCKNPRCVNPKHLEPVTPQENTNRGYWGNRTHCKHGHHFSDENTYLQTLRSGKVRRSCRECGRKANRENYHLYHSKEARMG